MAIEKRIRVVVDASDARKQIDALTKRLRGVGGATERASGATTRYSKSQQNLNNRIIGVNRSLNAMSGLLAKVASAAAAITAVRLADDFNELQNKLRITLQEGESLDQVQNKLIQTSLKTRSSLQENALLYLRLSNAVDRTKVSQQELFRITESVNKSIQLGGSNAQEAQGALRQFTQIISSGFVTGFSQELNSIVEQTPGLFKLLTDGLRETSQEFRDLEDSGVSGIKILKTFSEEGIGDLDMLLEAIASQAENVDEQFKKVNITVAKSLGNLRTAIESYIGKVDDQFRVTERVALAIDNVAQNFNDFIDRMQQFIIIGGSAVGTFVALKIAASGFAIATAAANTSLTALIAKLVKFVRFGRLFNPLTVVITAVAVGVGKIVSNFIDANDGFIKFRGTVSRSGVFIQAIIKTMLEFVSIFAEETKNMFDGLVVYIDNFFDNSKGAFEAIGSNAIESAKWIVEGFLDAFSLIGTFLGLFAASTVETFSKLGKNLAEALVQGLKGDIRSFDDLKDTIGQGLFSGLFGDMLSEEILKAANDDKIGAAAGALGEFVSTNIFIPLEAAADAFGESLARNIRLLNLMGGSHSPMGFGGGGTGPGQDTISAWDALIDKLNEYLETISAIVNATVAFTDLFGTLAGIRQQKIDDELSTSLDMTEKERKAKEKAAKDAFEANKSYTLAGIALQTGLAIMTALTNPNWIIGVANATTAAATGAAQYAKANSQQYKAPSPPSGAGTQSGGSGSQVTNTTQTTINVNAGNASPDEIASALSRYINENDGIIINPDSEQGRLFNG